MARDDLGRWVPGTSANPGSRMSPSDVRAAALAGLPAPSRKSAETRASCLIPVTPRAARSGSSPPCRASASRCMRLRRSFTRRRASSSRHRAPRSSQFGSFNHAHPGALPLLAQMRSAERVRKCLLFGVDRTYRGHHETDALDPPVGRAAAHRGPFRNGHPSGSAWARCSESRGNTGIVFAPQSRMPRRCLQP
jgi:hypothetical protein